MSKNIRRNQQCPCESGLKYKKCCLRKELEDYAWRVNFSEKMRRGEIPFTAQVIGNGGTMQVGKAFTTTDGEKTIYLNENIEIKAESLDDIKESSTTLSIYPNKISEGLIIGQGSIGNKGNYKYKLALAKKNKIKVKSENLFSIISISRDNTHFDVIFGRKGITESIEDGIKNRPHISFYPEGNSKYIRLSSYKCQMETKINYDPKQKDMSISEVKIIVDEYKETLILKFNFDDKEKTVKLINSEFSID